MYLLSAEASNRADWTLTISATDADTGDAIDFTGASIVFAVNDEAGCQRLLATTDNGKATLPTTSQIQISFTRTDMLGLEQATYLIGATYEIGGGTVQLMTGTVDIIDGVVPA